MNKSKYWKIAILSLISLLASFLISMHGNWGLAPGIFLKLNFYIAVFTSFFVCVLFIAVIEYISKKLDKNYDWKRRTKQRIIRQIVFCILIPAIADLVVFWIYLKLMRSDLIKSEFLLIDYPVVVSFIVLINCIHFGVYFLQPKTKNLLTINYKRTRYTFDLAEDILYFTRSGRKVALVTSKGREYTADLSIANLATQYEEAGFLQINRTTVINSRIVKSYTAPRDVKKSTMIVVFKAQYLEAIEDPEHEIFEITTAYLEDFKSKLEQI